MSQKWSPLRRALDCRSTLIGQGDTPQARWIALACGLSLVAFDLSRFGQDPWRAAAYWERAIPALFCVIALLALPRASGAPARAAALGLRWDVPGSWTTWAKYTGLAGLAVLLGALLVGGVLWMSGQTQGLDRQFASIDDFWSYLPNACVWAPLTEECIYRIILCAPLVPLIGARWTIWLGGLVFGYLHYRYGVLAPNHVFAGLVLTWAYLRSSNILVPILWHALGNLAVGLMQLGWFLAVPH